MNELKVNGTQEFMGINIPVIEGGFGENQKVILAKTVAEIHGVRMNDIQDLIKQNIKEFEIGIDLLDLMKDEYSLNLARGLRFITSNRQKNCYLLSESGYLKLYSLLRNKNENILKAIKYYFGNNTIQYIFAYNKEIRFRDRFSSILKEFNLNLEFQYVVNNYKIDIYIPSLNIAIEYDENNHKYYTYEQQELRQKEIEKELGCKFIRVSDEYSIDTSIGKVLKELMILK